MESIPGKRLAGCSVKPATKLEGQVKVCRENLSFRKFAEKKLLEEGIVKETCSWIGLGVILLARDKMANDTPENIKLQAKILAQFSFV